MKAGQSFPDFASLNPGYIFVRAPSPTVMHPAFSTAGASDEGPQAVTPGRKVTDSCLAMVPTFSSNGRWVHAALPDGRDVVRIGRWALSSTEDDGYLPSIGE